MADRFVDPAPVPGIPTVYRGTTFRSRNEARWASFFDELRWPWVYEPFDGHGYIPDFILVGQYPVLVEVKPDVSVDELGKYLPRATEGVRGVWTSDILVVGSTPLPYAETAFDGALLAIGALAESMPAQFTDDGRDGWSEPGVGVWNYCNACPRERFDIPVPQRRLSFHHDELWYRSRICGHGNDDSDWFVRRGFVEDVWCRASDRVRWQPGGAGRG